MNTLSFFGRLTLLCIASLTIMVGAVVAPGLSGISEALGVADNASLLITLPALGAVIFAPFSGRLIDRFGAYSCTLVALLLYGILGTSGQWFFGPTEVFINRMLLGGTATLLMAGGTTLISQFYSGHERLKMIAKQGMAIEIGGVLVLFAGGQLTVMGWNLPFYVYLIAIAFLIMLVLSVPNMKAAHSAPSTNQAQEQVTSEPLLFVYLSACVAMTLFFTAIVVLPLSMQDAGYNADKIGLFLAFISLIAVVTAHFLPRVHLRWKNQGTLGLAFAFYCLSHAAFYHADTLPMLLLGGLLSGMAFGLSIPLFNHITVEKSAPTERGKNLSYLAMAIFLGQFLTSFVELIPGDISLVYVVAGLGAGVYFFCALIIFKK
ncbi:MFS transporter [Marinomonas sp. NPDC078689]|uniref:MFS transporter n=1 Tax=Marinomonas sp. NPDC078689 TaxID=3364147 RepID=UPI0037C92137